MRGQQKKKREKEIERWRGRDERLCVLEAKVLAWLENKLFISHAPL